MDTHTTEDMSEVHSDHEVHIQRSATAGTDDNPPTTVTGSATPTVSRMAAPTVSRSAAESNILVNPHPHRQQVNDRPKGFLKMLIIS
ncbi:hypothetical protein Hamer_G014927 [Homarus americanus]|uniref:Uncharacterized protein n=1 Tax=Homarus americanus TaxID=6706 RepID=A0A8J5JKV8_HOMAM|nr:hypothetical protein Hamer_G014927 [Homarus americanus]